MWGSWEGELGPGFLLSTGDHGAPGHSLFDEVVELLSYRSLGLVKQDLGEPHEVFEGSVSMSPQRQGHNLSLLQERTRGLPTTALPGPGPCPTPRADLGETPQPRLVPREYNCDHLAISPPGSQPVSQGPLHSSTHSHTHQLAGSGGDTMDHLAYGPELGGCWE